MEMEITFPGGKKVDALYKGFTIKTDQSREAGGENSAPAPFDLFLASIGTCAGIYVLGFCQKRNISTDGLKISLNTNRDEGTHMIDKIKMNIHLPAGFPEKYREAVILSAELCSVKRHMENPPIFETKTLDTGEEENVYKATE
ncbi:MAG: OsmC family protein [Spirochaetes bacterium]|nr:OsmC family protein [Spirochaetota bacterium]